MMKTKKKMKTKLRDKGNQIRSDTLSAYSSATLEATLDGDMNIGVRSRGEFGAPREGEIAHYQVRWLGSWDWLLDEVQWLALTRDLLRS